MSIASGGRSAGQSFDRSTQDRGDRDRDSGIRGFTTIDARAGQLGVGAREPLDQPGREELERILERRPTSLSGATGSLLDKSAFGNAVKDLQDSFALSPDQLDIAFPRTRGPGPTSPADDPGRSRSGVGRGAGLLTSVERTTPNGGFLTIPPGEEPSAVTPLPQLLPEEAEENQPATPAPGDAAAPFEPADASVATQLGKVLASDSPLLTAARTRAKQEANRRGLLNSSIAVQAGEAAALDVALPIASQQAAQIHQRNISDSGLAAQERIASSNISAFNREKATAALAQFDNSYQAAFLSIANNENLPAETREAYIRHISVIRDSNFNLVEQLYNIDLVWASPIA